MKEIRREIPKVNEPEPDLMTANQVIEFAQVSPRQIQWWDERGILEPRIIGHRRYFTEREATEVRVIGEMRRKGLGTRMIQKVLKTMQRCLPAKPSTGLFVFIALSPGNRRPSNVRISIVSRAETASELTRARGGVFLVEIEEPRAAVNTHAVGA